MSEYNNLAVPFFSQVEFEIDKLIDENEKELEIYPKLVYEKKEYTSKEALLFVKIGELRK
ncbi:MAG: hypothetical protein J6A89_05690 [Clostridia bacterium]|nr:hypothetical protein [Clostridia bacterium]